METHGRTDVEPIPGAHQAPGQNQLPLTDAELRRLPPLRPTERVTATGQVREFHLVVEPVRWELVEEVWVEAWAYNGQVPGPSIRVTEGDTVRVAVVNRLPVPTSVHWHGLHVPNAVDGVPEVTEHGIAPGQTRTYEFIANHAGTFMYHSHADEIQQVDRGLSGALIIDPQDADAEPAYDHDLVMLFSGWAVPEPGAAHGAHAGGHKHDYNYWTINGKAFPDIPPVRVRYGDRVRLRLVNISQDMHPMHLHGHDFRVIAMDGHPLAQPQILNTVNVAPGQTVDVDFLANNPGRWLFHCHILHHASNNMTTPGGLTAVFEYAESDTPGIAGHGTH